MFIRTFFFFKGCGKTKQLLKTTLHLRTLFPPLNQRIDLMVFLLALLVLTRISETCHAVTHPESPRMMTFKSTFFLDVILSELQEDKRKSQHTGGSPRCFPNLVITGHNLINTLYCWGTIQSIKRVHLVYEEDLWKSLQVCEFHASGPIRFEYHSFSHVLSKLLSKSRGSYHLVPLSLSLALSLHRKLSP